MCRTRAGAAGGEAALAQRFRDDALRAACHFERRPARECQQQDSRRIDAFDHELRDAMRQCAGLAGARARDDE